MIVLIEACENYFIILIKNIPLIFNCWIEVTEACENDFIILIPNFQLCLIVKFSETKIIHIWNKNATNICS